VTYAAEFCEDICHRCNRPEPGDSDEVWWIGFDTAHAFDVMPGMQKLLRDPPWTLGAVAACDRLSAYRDMAFVRAEVEMLALQALAAQEDAEARR
jgi:hypothetical protein